MRAIMCWLVVLLTTQTAFAESPVKRGKGSIIGDGGFEKPAAPAGGYATYTLGSTIGPWTVVGPDNSNVALTSTTFTQNGFSFPARRGQSFLDLTGGEDLGLPQGVAQTVITKPGQSYQLSFWVGNVYDPAGHYGTSSTVNVFAGQTQIISATNSKRNGGMRMVWKAFSVSFVATAAQTTVSFINGDAGGSSDVMCGLDDITLIPAT